MPQHRRCSPLLALPLALSLLATLAAMAPACSSSPPPDASTPAAATAEPTASHAPSATATAAAPTDVPTAIATATPTAPPTSAAAPSATAIPSKDTRTYVVCGCGCCGGVEPEKKCLYRSKGDDLDALMAKDQATRPTPKACANVGCSRGTEYRYCD